MEYFRGELAANADLLCETSLRCAAKADIRDDSGCQQ